MWPRPRHRINTALTFAIRLAKNPVKTSGPAKEYKRIDNESRPEQAFVTEKAQRAGRANASSGRIMVTTPNDHFGPIGPEHDPLRNQVGAPGGDQGSSPVPATWHTHITCDRMS